MKRETTSSRVAARPISSHPLALFMGAVYGLVGGLVLALLLLSGLLPTAWAESFVAGPFALQGLLSASGAVVGVLVMGLRLARK